MLWNSRQVKRSLAMLAGALALLAVGVTTRAQTTSNGGNVYDLNAKGETVVTTATLRVEGGDASISSATLSLLRSLEKFHKDVKTIHATFAQEREDEAFQEKVKSPGELWFEKPAHYRCDYTEPNPLVTLITDDTFYMYLKEQNQVEFYKFASVEERDQQLHQLLIVFGFNTDELVRRYEIRSAEDDPALRAELAADKQNPERKAIFQVRPRPAFEESCPFKVMKVTIDKASHLPDKIWYKDPSDAAITLMMQKMERDARLPADIFDKSKIFPPGVELIDKRNAQ